MTYNNLHDLLKKIKGVTLLNSTEITQWFGIYNNSNPNSNPSQIHYMVILDGIYICFHENWTNSVISDFEFNCFTQSIEALSYQICVNSPIYSIYLSKQPFLDTTEDKFDMQNYNFSNGLSRIKYFKLNNYNKNELLKNLHIFLHTHHIFLYDDDDDCIMV